MTHPTSLEHLVNDKIRGLRAEGLRSQQLKRRGKRALAGKRALPAKRALWAAAGIAGLVLAVNWLF